MKLIHVSDVHLSSRFKNLDSVKSKIRQRELMLSFEKVLNYAENNNVEVILLTGDIFDGERIFQKDYQFFYQSIFAHPKITFYYLRGNHDYYSNYELLPNLKIFSQEWTYYQYQDLVIAGIELNESNKLSLYSSLNLDKEKFNIVMLHGDIYSPFDKYGLSLKKLSDKNIDYLALGHIHQYQCGKIDNRGEYLYSGNLEGRGFDELGEKGFEVLEIDNHLCKHYFVNNSIRIVKEIIVDISKAKNAYEAVKEINKYLENEEPNLIRLRITGIIPFGKEELMVMLNSILKECFYLEIKDDLIEQIDYQEYQKSLSLRGEFIKEIQNSSLSIDDQSQVIRYALKALRGEKI